MNRETETLRGSGMVVDLVFAAMVIVFATAVIWFFVGDGSASVAGASPIPAAKSIPIIATDP